MVTEAIDPVYDMTNVSDWSGLPASELGKAYTDEFIGNLASTVIDLGTSEAGARFFQFLAGTGLGLFGILGSDWAGLSRRTRADIHQIAAAFLTNASAKSFDGILQTQDDILNIKREIENSDNALKGMTNAMLRDTNEIQSEIESIWEKNRQLAQEGIPIPNFLQAGPSMGGGESSRGPSVGSKGPSIESAIDAVKSQPTEAKMLNEDITIRGGA